MTALKFSELCNFTEKQWTATHTADAHLYTLFGGSRGPGKALALETPIPTPAGWACMGDLCVGDEVIGRDGAPCRVTWVSPVWADRPCYRLTFDDGTAIVADAAHEWLVFSRNDRRALVHRTEGWRAARRARRQSRGTGAKPWVAARNAATPPPTKAPPAGLIRTTAQIAETLKASRGAESNWSVPTCGALDMPAVALPIDPYVLGVWLGDGTSSMGSITSADSEIVEELQAAGYAMTKWAAPYLWNAVGLKAQLRALGVLGNKHIPAAYMRASKAQRLALLQGLMDTDGSVDKDGRVEFTGMTERLVRGLWELVLSLGYKATLRTGRATLDGRDCGPKWRVGWSAEEPMFRLSRKAERQKVSGFNGVHHWRYIVACEAVDSVAVRCIEVDSPDHLYLASESWIPTHNSFWLRWYLLRFLLRAAQAGFPGMRVMLGCEDYPSLTDRHLTKVQTEFPAWLGYYVGGDRKEFRLAPHYGGGAIAFRNLDDPSKYQSSEFACIAIDELTKNPERTFHILRGSLRWPGFEGVRFVAATNPEANWVREFWIERTLPEALRPAADQFAFVPALPDDNPHLPSSYWAMLDTLPDALRQAWRHGDWYAAVEGLVYASFTADNLHDAEPNEARPWYVAIDDGYIDPRATLFVQPQQGGGLHVFDELYQTQTLEEVTIDAIKAKAAEHGLRLPTAAIVSHEAVALRARLAAAGIPAVNWLEQKAGGGRSTRMAAVTLTRGLICDGQNQRSLHVHRRCARLLDEVRAGYKYPPGRHGLETMPADGNDHACQALESVVWWMYGSAKRQRPRVREY